MITDPADPHLDSAVAFCDGTIIDIFLNKKMRCNSLATDGSDFNINYPLTTIIDAAGEGCSSSFDLDHVRLTLSDPLPPGNYNITIKNGTDGNTLKDVCERQIAVDETIPLTVLPVTITQMDSLTTPKCAPGKFELVFRKKIRCSSIAADGSDFIINGSYAAAVISAGGNCADGLTDRVIVELASPMFRGGNFNVRLVSSPRDGNTLIDECGQEIPGGSFLPFNLKDTVSADFTFSTRIGCELDTVQFIHNGAHQANEWNWVFDVDRISQIQSPQIYYSTPGTKMVSLAVSNGFCSSSRNKTVTILPKIKAGFEASRFACPAEPALFKDTSSGNVSGWFWEFSNGNSFDGQNPPPQFYPVPDENYSATVILTVRDERGCTDTASAEVMIVKNCFIAVPSAFTPNGDGLNDFLYPLNAYKAKNLNFAVYNRLGQRIFFTSDWQNKWDGRYRGQGADPGTYVWTLHYVDGDTNQPVHQKGTVILIR